MEVKAQIFQNLNLNDYQFNSSRYSYRSTYINPVVNTNQESTIDKQKLRRKKYKILLKQIIKPQRKKQKEEMNREELKRQPENKYKSAVSTFLSIITLNTNGLTSPIKRHKVADE